MNNTTKTILGLLLTSTIGVGAGIGELTRYRQYQTQTTTTETTTQVAQNKTSQNEEVSIQDWNRQVIQEMVNDGLDRAHTNLLQEVADRGVVLFYNTQPGEAPEWVGEFHCGADMMPLYGVQGFLGGWYDSSQASMQLCNEDGRFDQWDTHVIRHEVAHYIQDLNDGRQGDATMTSYWDTTKSDFQNYLNNQVSQDGQDYVNSYCEIGEYETCALEADAEVQATSDTPQDLVNRIREFTF